MKATPYNLVNGFLYKMGLDDILRWCVLEHERENIIYEADYAPTGGHFQADTTAKKIQQSGLWWPTLYKDCKKLVSQCDRCQQLGRPLPSIEMPLISVNLSLTFEIWAIPHTSIKNRCKVHNNCNRICNQVGRSRTCRHMFQWDSC